MIYLKVGGALKKHGIDDVVILEKGEKVGTYEYLLKKQLQLFLS